MSFMNNNFLPIKVASEVVTYTDRRRESMEFVIGCKCLSGFESELIYSLLGITGLCEHVDDGGSE